MTIRINDAGMAILKKHEKCSLVSYWDIDGWSIGWGCHNHPLVDALTRWSQEQCDQQLIEDIEAVESELDHLLTIIVTSNEWSALVDFLYNEGYSHLSGSTLLKLVNAGDFKGAADEFPKWRVAGGKPNADLEARRADERALFLTPDQA